MDRINRGTSDRASRAAWLGLGAVVLCLAAFSILAAYVVQTQTEQVIRHEARHAIFEDASKALLADEAMQLESLVLPSAKHDADRILADQRVIGIFNEIGAQRGAEDVALANDLLRLHEQYIRVYAGISAAAAIGNQNELLRLHNIEDPLYHEMRDRIAAVTKEAQAVEESAYATLDLTSRWMLILSPVAFAIGFALLFGLWRILNDADRVRQKTYQEIEQLSRHRAEFVSTVSHEFRTPLTGIQGFSEMMRDEDLSIAEMREFAGDIHKDAERLARLISDMLDLNRLESGLATAKLVPFDLNRILTDTAAQFRLSAAQHPIELNLDPRVPELMGDPDRMTQVVTNLLSNAIKYSPDGGTVEVRTKCEAKTATFTVSDQGIGLPTDQLETIFERYTRIQTAATQNITGTGLGLPIVRQIVELYQGKVWATSKLGQGSVFHVQLPLHAASLEPHAARPRALLGSV